MIGTIYPEKYEIKFLGLFSGVFLNFMVRICVKKASRSRQNIISDWGKMHEPERYCNLTLKVHIPVI